MEAVRTNVIGTDNTLTAAMAAGVKNVVVLSTDKAAYPINAMGMSKALMEKVRSPDRVLLRRRERVFCVTRYGNVMASRGSVIPLFVDQILRGHPLTVTDPEMTRFMMSLDDAVDLVLYAFQNGEPGRPLRAEGACRDHRYARSGHVVACSAPLTQSRSSAPATARSSTRRC